MRLLTMPALAVGLPLGSFVALRMNLIPTPWLAAPDAVLTMGLMIGLLSRGGALWRLVVGILASALTLAVFRVGPEPSAIAYPVLLNLFLGRFFHQSLCGDREPVISRIARIERGHLPQDVAAYTRSLTQAWCLFFLLMAAELSLVARFGTIETYMLFANTINLLFAAAFFVLEYLYRRSRFPQYPQKPLLHFICELMDGGWLGNESMAGSDATRPTRR